MTSGGEGNPAREQRRQGGMLAAPRAPGKQQYVGDVASAIARGSRQVSALDTDFGVTIVGGGEGLAQL